MTHLARGAVALMTLFVVPVAQAQEPDARQIAQERRQAESDLPHLVEALDLKPGILRRCNRQHSHVADRAGA